VVEEDEGGEVGQLHALVVDERCLDTAVGQKDPVGQLGQCLPVGAHVGSGWS
jgi:hypothetical protein